MSTLAHRRLLLVSHTFDLTGAPHALLAVGQGLAARGALLSVVGLRDGPLRGAFESLGPVRVFDPRRVPLAKLMPRAVEPTVALRIRSFAQRQRAELIYANTLESLAGPIVARSLRLPCLWFVHESVDPTNPATPRARWIRRALGPGVDCVFVAQATRRLFEPLLGGGLAAHVVPNGVDLARIDAFREAHSGPALRASLGLKPGQRVVLLVGTTTPRKGQHVFVDAALILRGRHPECVFLMVGARPGPFLERLRRQVALAQAQDVVRFVPETEHVLRYYQVADVCVMASFEESHPLVVLEAMAFERPLVATRVFGVPEQVTSGAEALLVPPGQPLALARGIERLLDDPELAVTLGRRARARCEAEFALPRMLEAHADLVRGLL